MNEYKLTGDGGIPILCGSFEEIVEEIVTQHDGRRYVRRAMPGSNQCIVLIVDVERDEFYATWAGKKMDREMITDHAPWIDLVIKAIAAGVDDTYARSIVNAVDSLTRTSEAAVPPFATLTGTGPLEPGVELKARINPKEHEQ